MTTGAAGRGADDELLAAAVRWHSRLRDQPESRAVRARFETWLAADPRHAESYAEAERLWSRVGVRCEDEGPSDETAIGALVAKGRRKRRSPGRVAPALLILALSAGALGWWDRGGWDDLGADYVTSVGAQRPVALADGSTLELSTDTSVAVELAADRREAKLFRGEAFFRVAPDAARPFTVETADARVRVTGTAFNVRRTDGDTQVSVVEGHVEVTPLGEPGGQANLRAGDHVTVDRRGVRRVGVVDPDSAAAWRRGQLVFFDEPLGTVVQELNRYAAGRHLVLSPQLRDRRVTGVFNARDIDGALDLVRQKFGVGVFTVGGGRLTILH